MVVLVIDWWWFLLLIGGGFTMEVFCLHSTCSLYSCLVLESCRYQ